MGWCFYSHLVLRCTNRHQIKPIFLAVYVYEVVLFLASCTSMYKQAPKQTYLYLFMFTGLCFQSQLVLRCTNRHQNKPIFSCLCSRDGALTRILYFGVQTGTKQTYFQLFMFIGWCFYSHLVLRCTNRHQNKPFFQMLMFMRWCLYSHLVLRCTNKHQNKPIFSCLCLWDGAFTHILYFGVQTGTQSNLFSWGLIVYLCGVAFSRSLYFGVQTGTKSIRKKIPTNSQSLDYCNMWTCSFHGLLWSGPDEQII